MHYILVNSYNSQMEFSLRGYLRQSHKKAMDGVMLKLLALCTTLVMETSHDYR